MKITTVYSDAHTDSARRWLTPAPELFTGIIPDQYSDDISGGISYDKVSVVIPTLNEASNLSTVLTALPETIGEIIIVDGGSTDGTPEVARMLRNDVILIHQRGRGKGNALVQGFEKASGQIIVMLDADGSTDPREISRFLKKLCTEKADFVKGSRYMDGGGSEDITFLRKFGNTALRILVNACYGTSFTDLCYGYCAFYRNCLPALQLTPTSVSDDRVGSDMRLGDGFEIETLLCIKAACAGLNIAEVPSFELRRGSGASNLHVVRDGLRVLRVILGNLFNRNRSAKVVDAPVAKEISRWPIDPDYSHVAIEQSLSELHPEVVL